MKIRIESRSDCTTIETLTYRAFENHPHHAPGAKPTEHLIINNLREGRALTLSLIAEDETGIIGHIAFSPVTISGASSQWYGLGPVSVIPERQGEGIGSQLIRAGIDNMKAQGAQGLVVLGEPEYYGRFGFNAHSSMTLPGVPSEFFMIQLLRDDSSAIPEGEVAYHSAFNG
ncbi:GNAT family N-acetyltransferase [Endozoicomonas sp. (ex Bugula neritina AB1)]|nr:GNAT family N-acetyltransferase [Endozoicomonas sp. (ex Bugula neritina AB1)]